MWLGHRSFLPHFSPVTEANDIFGDDQQKADLLNDTFVNQNTSINPEAFPFGPTNIKSVFHFTLLSAREVGNASLSHYPTTCMLVLMENFFIPTFERSRPLYCRASYNTLKQAHQPGASP